MHNTLTILQAFKAMQNFLEDYYNKTLSDDLGSLLGGLQLFSDGGTFDPAMWQEWQDAVGSHNNLTVIQAFNSMQRFLKNYCNYVDSAEIKNLINVIEQLPEGGYDRIIWAKWQDSVKQVLKNKNAQ